jgi:hypothetical protein
MGIEFSPLFFEMILHLSVFRESPGIIPPFKKKLWFLEFSRVKTLSFSYGKLS